MTIAILKFNQSVRCAINLPWGEYLGDGHF